MITESRYFILFVLAVLLCAPLLAFTQEAEGGGGSVAGGRVAVADGASAAAEGGSRVAVGGICVGWGTGMSSPQAAIPRASVTRAYTGAFIDGLLSGKRTA